MKRPVVAVVLFLVAILTCSVPVSALTYEKEREIAREFITTLESGGLIVHNPEITWVMQELTDRLAARVANPMYSFRVHLVRDRSVNAFAIPDGHIFINLGTLLFVKDLDELASVIGHEMGHCQLRHIPKSFEAQKKISTASIVGVLLGALLSAQNPEVGSAMIISAMGGGQNLQLAYSRKHEYEADEFSRNILKKAGIDPSAMSRFLVTLRTYSGASNIPEYFLTHPHTADRIAAVQREMAAAQPDEDYRSMVAATIGLLLPEPEAAQRARTLPKPYDRLALGIVLVRSARYSEALDRLEGIDHPLAHCYRGLALYHLQRPQEALPLLQDYGHSARSGIAIAEIMQARGQPAAAVTALEPYARQHPRVDYLLGNLYENSSRDALAHVSYARYFFSTRAYPAARHHIEQALAAGDDLDKVLARELKDMRKAIGKLDPSGNGRRAG